MSSELAQASLLIILWAIILFLAISMASGFCFNLFGVGCLVSLVSYVLCHCHSLDENTGVWSITAKAVASQHAPAPAPPPTHTHIFTSRPGSVALRAVLVGPWDQSHFKNLEIGFFSLLGNESCILLKMIFGGGEGAVCLYITGRLRESESEQELM